ncbi:thiamine biosynthetic bifunctional enzyme TH1, chloroplastic [Silene latifolia]|uniref:thiamine biosynthetic bifunctional enzyme TH1, chloroplastic n=1 Tax=Silene latifolia TaxID=37657 RepID=UPI003D774BC3
MLHSHLFSSSTLLNCSLGLNQGKLRSPEASRRYNNCKVLMASRVNDGAKEKIPHVLTVAGSDSGAGAGIQADLKACAALGVYCSTVITAVTAQNTVGVQGVNILPEEFVAEQLKSVLSDMQVDVVKTGMLPSIGMVRVLLQHVKEYPPKAMVVDPVMVSTSGDVLAGSSVLPVFREELLPMADLVTPNIKEASVLLGGMQLETVDDMRRAAKLIYDMGPRNVLLKGGDLPASMDAVDIFFDGNTVCELSSSRIKTRNTHGTGCTLASSIAAELAKGLSMISAVKIAKRFIDTALHYGKDMDIGRGPQGPFDHFMKLKSVAGRSIAPQLFRPEDLFLYAVTDSRMNKKWDRSMADAVRAAIEGGATIVQLREKDVDTLDFIEAAKECLSICHSKGIHLLINDRVDVALACNADGVHVGQSDMPVPLVRSLLGPEKIIGISCKTPEQARQAWIDGADYIGSGGVFPTNTKANNRTIGLDGLKDVCLASKLPVVAIGGIGASKARSVIELDAPNLEGVAVVSALFDTECVYSATRELYGVLQESVPRRK